MNLPTLIRPPRYGTPRRSSRPTRGKLLADVSSLLGWDQFGWQRHVGDVSLEYDELTRVPRYRTVGVSVARQNGKTTLVCARIALQLIRPGSVVAYTAQDRNLARFKWDEHVTRLLETPFASRVRKVDRVNGREQLVMTNGSRYLIVTPGEKAGRSLSIDLAVVDEAFAHESMGLVGALVGTMAARRHAQLWLLSNAGSPRSLLWRHYTELGRSLVGDPASSLCWLEWCPPEDADPSDPETWREANPTLDLPNGVSSVALADSLLTLDSATFAREHLNLWPDLSSVLSIDPVSWAACRDDDLRPSETIALSIDLTPERDRGAVVIAGDVEGRTPLEVIETSSDIERLIARAVEIAQRWSATVVIDRGSPAGSAIPAFERAGVTVRLISLPDLVRACGDFHDAVTHGRLTHRGDYRLTDAVAAATKRPVGDAWVWRRRGGADISPLVAATLARWGIVGGSPLPEPMVW